MIVVILMGGFSLGADSAMPGGILYPVKVNINEEIRSQLAFSQRAKVAWDIRRVERRMEEAEQMAVRGTGDASSRAVVEANFQAYADRVSDRIHDMEARGDARAAAEAASNFEASLKAHQAILARLSGESATAGLTPLLIRVRAVVNTAAENRVSAETHVSAGADVQAAAEGKMTAAENKIAEVESFIARSKAKLGAEAAVQAEARLTEARAVAAEGKAKIQAGAWGEAFVLFQKAARIAQEAQMLVDVRANSQINVNITGVEESPVPAGTGVEGGAENRGNLELQLQPGLYGR